MSEPSVVRAIDRTIDVLIALTAGPQGLTKLAAATGLSKATTHRVLQSLQLRQMVVQDRVTFDYALGIGWTPLLAAIMRGNGGLGLVALGELEALRQRVDETATLHVPAYGQRICVAEVPSTQPVRYVAGVGVSHPIYTGAAGKVLLAYATEELQALWKAGDLRAVTDRTITSFKQLTSEIQTVRDRGFAVSRGERVSGAAAVSVPVFDRSGQLVAALSVLGPEDRITRRPVEEWRDALLWTSAKITKLFPAPWLANAKN